ncbi:hypothetical protein ScPMuIL_005262 [Solemya velum]
MERTVGTLEAMFQKAESDLNYLSRKLEFEFGNQDEDGTKVNPAKMMPKIAEIKKEYANLVTEAAAIQKAQMEAMDFFRCNLLSVCDVLQKLQQDTGKWNGEKPEELVKLEEMLGVNTEMPCIPLVAEAETTATTSQSHSIVVQQSKNSEQQKKSSEPACSVSPASRRKGSDECMEITEEEFESVSNLIRGRAKLSEVNSTYSVLWTHFKEAKKSSPPLTTSEMYKMGLKVSGATGEAKLKVLRALKLLNINSKGAVKIA